MGLAGLEVPTRTFAALLEGRIQRTGGSHCPPTHRSVRMASADLTRPTGATAGAAGRPGLVRRLATETKAAFKTTEFWSFLAVVAAILVSAAAIKGGDSGGTDEFIARQAWLYVAIVTAA